MALLVWLPLIMGAEQPLPVPLCQTLMRLDRDREIGQKVRILLHHSLTPFVGSCILTKKGGFACSLKSWAGRWPFS
jgi:hypothetical protein